ncbi:MAG: diphthine--ammonia ligase [Methanobacteriota archaeon]|nr:MAG: diphthine--ammonia ligase [Euryarchaeota archaeon]
MVYPQEKRFCSWSGGKDSCLAFHRSTSAGQRPSVLLTMLTEGGERSRSHGLSVEVLKGQASALGARLVTRATSWDDYEADFVSTVQELRAEGLSSGVFGDIDLEGHREWVTRVCSIMGVKPVLPLWQRDRRELLDEFVSSGFRALIVSVRNDVLNRDFLGRILDDQTVEELETAGVDICGEGGEYHTFVTDGPAFSRPVRVEHIGTESHDGYSFLELRISDD